MKSVILYGRTTKPEPGEVGGYSLICLKDGQTHTMHRIYVRAQMVRAAVDVALDMAKPRKGETVLNTILI